jgi:hypothetical protein
VLRKVSQVALDDIKLLYNASACLETEAKAELPVIAHHAFTVKNQTRKTDPETLTAKLWRKGRVEIYDMNVKRLYPTL